MSEATVVDKPQGALGISLARNSDKVRTDRARQIADSARMRYRRLIEDLHLKLREYQNNQDAILDMSPDNTQSLINAQNFEPEKFVKQNTELAKNIFDVKQVIEVLTADYERLFGEELQINL